MCPLCQIGLGKFSASSATRAEFQCDQCGDVFWRKSSDPVDPPDPPEPEPAPRSFWSDTDWSAISFNFGLALVMVVAIIYLSPK